MTIITVSHIKWAGQTHKSHAVLDTHGEVNFPATMYLVNLSLNGKSYNTTLNYAYRLESYFTVLQQSGEMDWRLVDDETMTVYINQYLHNTKNLSISSIEGHIACLESFYKWAWEHGFLKKPLKHSFILSQKNKQSSVLLHSNKDTRRYLGQYIEPTKLESLLEHLKTNDPFLLERNEIILSLGYSMGLRRSEIVHENNLKLTEFKRLKNLSKSERNLTIIGKGPKTRIVPIPPKLYQMIENFVNGRHKTANSQNIICNKNGRCLSNSLPYVIFKQAAIRTQDPFWDQKVFHSLRHSYATNMVSKCYEEKIDPWVILPEYMGHNDKSTTLSYVFFEAILNNRHSLLKKLLVQEKHIGKRNRYLKN